MATRELKGHGYALNLMDAVDAYSTGQVDVLECSSGDGFVFVDLLNLNVPVMTDRFTIAVYFPTTDEVGAAADGSATQTIALGHPDSITATDDYIYISDGPHGVSAWKITDDFGYPTDNVHLVANTLQDEYPEEVAAGWFCSSKDTTGVSANTTWPTSAQTDRQEKVNTRTSGAKAPDVFYTFFTCTLQPDGLIYSKGQTT